MSGVTADTTMMTTVAHFQSRAEATIQATLPTMATTEGHANRIGVTITRRA
jgi:hypothetical protein